MTTQKAGHFFQIIVLTMIVSSYNTAFAHDIYVAPTGTPTGDGSKAKPLDVFTALSAKSPAQPGDTIYLMEGVYEGKMNGIERGPFDLAVSGTADKPIRIRPVPGQSALLNGTGLVTSSYAHYMGLDIGDLQWDPQQKQHKASTAVNVGITAVCKETKIINCNIFGGDMGIGAWTPALNLEIYGCLIHDFGSAPAEGRGHGHAWYAQNKEGTKVFANNIAYRGMGWNVHVYTQGGSIEGFDILNNICYIAGAGKPNQTPDNYLIAGYPAADRIRLVGNVGYQPSNVDKWRPNARMTSYSDEVTNGTAIVKDNYFMGAPIGLLVGRWNDIRIEGNTIWAFDTLVDMGAAVPDAIGKNYKVDRNSYIGNGKETVFGIGGQVVDFGKWQALSLDKQGQFMTGRNGKPAGNKVFVFANKYEQGRANIGAFNWEGKNKIEVDLSSVLRKGQRYNIYNCLDIKQAISMAKPILAGTYQGKEIELPLRKDKISPDFDAFLVLPVR